MRKFKYALKFINNHEQFVGTHREQQMQDGATAYLLESNRKMQGIIEMMAFALALMAMVVAFKIMWRE